MQNILVSKEHRGHYWEMIRPGLIRIGNLQRPVNNCLSIRGGVTPFCSGRKRLKRSNVNKPSMTMSKNSRKDKEGNPVACEDLVVL